MFTLLFYLTLNTTSNFFLIFFQHPTKKDTRLQRESTMSLQFEVKKKKRRRTTNTNPLGGGLNFVASSSTSSNNSQSKSSTTTNHKPQKKGLSFFDDAAARAAKRRKLLSEEVGENGTIDLNASNKTIEIEAIPLQASQLFTGAAKFSEDIDHRPEQISVTDTNVFKKMPVEAFGLAMLRGMGWSKSTPEVGGSVRDVVEPYVPDGRGGRMGIGAMEAMEAEEEDKDQKKNKNKKKNNQQEQSKKNSSSSSSSTSSSSSSSSSVGVDDGGWLCAGIRVRIVAETTQLDNGNRYGEKGVVNDVLPSMNGGVECVLIMSDSVTIANVQSGWLSTALPKKGGKIKIVMGKFKGICGVLLKRDKKKELATVQLDSAKDGETIKVGYDSLSELVC